MLTLDGNALSLDPVLPADCATQECRMAGQYAVSVSYPGLDWSHQD